MKLLKENKRTTDVVCLELDNNLIRTKIGKLGQVASFSSTSKFSNQEAAVSKIEEIIQGYLSKGYKIVDEKVKMPDPEIFDKAKWHVNNVFPSELKNYQAYIPTGFYIGWLIMQNLVSNEFKTECFLSIKKFRNKEMTCVKLYEEELDGVFTSNEVNQEGLSFTEYYYDFSEGNYLHDYENKLCLNLPTLFHVQDTWENFEQIRLIIDVRYNEWRAQSTKIPS